MSRLATFAPWLEALAADKWVRVLTHRLDRRVLFAFAHEGFIRNFRDVITNLAQRGVHVAIVLSKQHDAISIADYGFLPHPHAAIDVIALREDLKDAPEGIERLRILRDILHLSANAFEAAPDVRGRFASLQGGLVSPAQIRRLEGLVERMSAPRRRRWMDWLDRNEAATAPRSDWARVLSAFDPHLVVVSPYVHYNSQEVDIVKVARARGTPTLLAVASWDNLTNKGAMKQRPDQVAVWNTAMAREAVELHGVAPSQISITGAPVFDRWFERTPKRSREDYCKALGLDPAQKIVLYLCSSHSMTGGHERSIVSRCLAGIRMSPVRALKLANVVVRPHPMALNVWSKLESEDDADAGAFKSARIWPLAPKHPSNTEGDEEYFETLYYADAVVGLNTSGMIESAILQKPIFTFTDHDAGAYQTGNLHFAHLHEGLIQRSESLEEMIQKLSAVIGSTKHWAPPQGADPMYSFVRPIARKRSASGVLADLLAYHADRKAAGASLQKQTWINYEPDAGAALGAAPKAG